MKLTENCPEDVCSPQSSGSALGILIFRSLFGHFTCFSDLAVPEMSGFGPKVSWFFTIFEKVVFFVVKTNETNRKYSSVRSF